MRRTWALSLGVVSISVGMIGFLTPAAHAGPALPSSEPSGVVCDQPPGDPAPGTAAWQERDLNNLECATQRQQDEVSNPSFLRMWAIENGENDPGTEITTILNQFENSNPTAPLGDLASSTIGDPFRVPTTWQADGRGQQTLLTMNSTDGAHLNARLYWPNGPGPFPGVVMIPGLQAYNEVYEWLGRGPSRVRRHGIRSPTPRARVPPRNCPTTSTARSPAGPRGAQAPRFDDPTSDETQIVAMTSALDFLLSTPAKPDLDGDGGNPHAGERPRNPAI